jgi:hypothetical protein
MTGTSEEMSGGGLYNVHIHLPFSSVGRDTGHYNRTGALPLTIYIGRDLGH